MSILRPEHLALSDRGYGLCRCVLSSLRDEFSRPLQVVGKDARARVAGPRRGRAPLGGRRATAPGTVVPNGAPEIWPRERVGRETKWERPRKRQRASVRVGDPNMAERAQ